MAVPPLTSAEVEFFMREGYIIRRQVLDPALLAAATDRWWQTNQVKRLQRDQPYSWLQPFTAEESSADDHNQRAGMSWRCRGIANEELLLDLLPRRLFLAAEQLCGVGSLIWPEGKTKPGFNFGHPGGNFHGKGTPGQACRGVYCNLPSPDAERKSIDGHVDGWANDRWRLSCHCFLGDSPGGVPAAGGGFGIWPTSHRQLWHRHRGTSYSAFFAQTHLSDSDLAAMPPEAWQESEEYERTLRRIRDTITPVDCALAPGDVILWHHRMMHTGGGWQNLSRHIRAALIYDFTRKDEGEQPHNHRTACYASRTSAPCWLCTVGCAPSAQHSVCPCMAATQLARVASTRVAGARRHRNPMCVRSGRTGARRFVQRSVFLPRLLGSAGLAVHPLEMSLCASMLAGCLLTMLHRRTSTRRRQQWQQQRRSFEANAVVCVEWSAV